jgi:hypothetical protein
MGIGLAADINQICAEMSSSNQWYPKASPPNDVEGIKRQSVRILSLTIGRGKMVLT